MNTRLESALRAELDRAIYRILGGIGLIVAVATVVILST